MKVLVIIAAVLSFAVSSLAQTTTGRLAGTVSGPDGVLPGATVTATDSNTNRELTVTTGDNGAFLFPQVEFGTYTVKVTAPGFKTFVANEVKIDVGREYNLNPVLEVGGIEETVTVTAGADVVTATSAQISNTVSPEQILSLPLIARNPLALATLQAGVQSNPAQNTTINGMRTTMTNITRDGINIQDAYIRTNATDFAPGRPTVDDTAEFTISTSNQEADQGFGGSQIRLVTPRGTKDFSGALYAYNRNSAFAANSFFNNRTGAELPFRNRNNFGGKLGGSFPIFNFGEGGPMFLKDKAFFFVNYDKLIDPVSASATRTILTPGARAGQFQYNRTTTGDAINQQIGTATVTCPARPNTSTVSICTVSNILGFATGRGLANIPSAINPVIQQRILAQLPTESNFTGGDQLNTAGYRFNRQSDQERTTFTSRFDLDLNDRNTFNLVYSWNLETNLRDDTDSTGFTQTPRYTQTSENRTVSMAYRTIISPKIVNEIRAGGFFSSVPWFFTSADNGLPEFILTIPQVNSATLITNPELVNAIQGRTTGNKTIMDNVDWIIGNHNLRFGGQYQRFRVDTFDEFGLVPSYTISTGTATPAFLASQFPGGISSAQLNTANGLLALFGGIVSAGQQTYNLTSRDSGFQLAQNLQPFRYSNHSVYISDRWQATPNLTITGGLRYELYPAMRIANGLGLEPVIADPDNPLDSILSRNGTYNYIGGNAGREGLLYKTDYNNFAPQIGFAWAPKFDGGFGKFLLGENFVVRGGYGVAYAMESILRALDNAYTGNQGLAGTLGRSVDPVSGSTNLNLRLGANALPPTSAPAFIQPPRTFIQNNSPPITNFFGTVWAIDPHLQIPKIEQYSIGIQREIFRDMAFEARYVGTRSNSLIRGIDNNQIDIFSNGFLGDFERARANLALTGNPFCTSAGCQTLQIFRPTGVVNGAPVTGSPGRLLVGASGTSGGVAFPAGLSSATFTNQLTAGSPAQLAALFINSSGNLNNHPSLTNPNAQPFINFVANPATGVVDLLSNDAMYYYNSLQLEVRKRFSYGLYFQANYTYSKNITNAIGTGQTLFEPYLDNNNKDLDTQRADYDQTHVFNFNGVYQLPFGKGRMFLNEGGIANAIFGGWELSGLINWSSGAPISFVDPRGTLNRDARSPRQTANSNLSPDEIRALMGVFEQNGNIYWINPSVIDPGTGRASNGFGTAPFEGQAFFPVNPGETGNLPRTIVNSPKYFNINAALLKNISFTERTRLQLRMEAFNVLNNVNFLITAAQQLQNITSPTFGQITSAGAARTIQFGARFEF